jgi:hypothetical protein
VGKPIKLKSFVRSTWTGWTACALLGAMGWVLHVAHDIALSHRAFVSGWALVVAMVLLTIYNLRKKIDFLPAVFSSRHWLWAHLVTGYLSVFLFVLHVGLRLPEGLLETTLWIQFVVVIGSGIAGHYVSRRFPHLLSDRGQEVLYERIPVLIRQQRERVEEAVLSAARGDSLEIPEFYQQRLADYFAGPRHLWQHLFKSRRPVQVLLRGLDGLEKLSGRGEQEVIEEVRAAILAKDDLDFHHAHQTVLKYWLFLHVPLAYSLLVVMSLHVVLAYAFGGIV